MRPQCLPCPTTCKRSKLWAGLTSPQLVDHYSCCKGKTGQMFFNTQMFSNTQASRRGPCRIQLLVLGKASTSQPCNPRQTESLAGFLAAAQTYQAALLCRHLPVADTTSLAQTLLLHFPKCSALPRSSPLLLTHCHNQHKTQQRVTPGSSAHPAAATTARASRARGGPAGNSFRLKWKGRTRDKE